jgi:GntR family transcriptional regulator / MocR family aminotransferase
MLTTRIRPNTTARPAETMTSVAIAAIAETMMTAVASIGDQAIEMAVAEILESGELARHARRALNVYRARRDSFASLLRANLGELVQFQTPSGGLAIWIELIEHERIQRLNEKARAKHFSILPSESFRMAEFATRGLRLGFASKNNNEMAEAIRRLRVLSD